MTTATVDPAQPDGDNGWWRTPPRMTLAAADAGFGVARTEYRIDTGAWTPYATPFLVRDGVHTVQYRSVDKAGNIEAVKSLPVKVDTTAPTPKVTGVRAGESYGDATDLALSLSGTDTTSGIASVTGTLAETVPLHLLDLGEHTLFVTAVDKAGNTAMIAVEFTVTTSYADVTTLIECFHTEGALDRTTASLLTREVDQARRHARRDQLPQAEAALNRVVQHVERAVTDPIVARVLIRDAQALVADLTR